MIDPNLRRKQILTFIVFAILLFAACTWSIASGNIKYLCQISLKL